MDDSLDVAIVERAMLLEDTALSRSYQELKKVRKQLKQVLLLMNSDHETTDTGEDEDEEDDDDVVAVGDDTL